MSGAYRALFTILISCGVAKAQEPDLLKELKKEETPARSHVTNAFKSSRVINNHSIEFIGKGVLDVRFLHRFGTVNSGIKNLFGLDQANTRIGFDYGLSNRVMAGFGRSNVGKELDAFIKYRPIWQSNDPGGSPVSVVWVSGITVNTAPWAFPELNYDFEDRLAYFHEIIIGRKFTESFSLQLNPILVHRNLAPANGHNNTFALGIGSRLKLTKRTAFMLDYQPVLSGRQTGTKDMLAVGFDIETGGHVFQLHFTNATGMNEKAFITGTTDDFWKGDIRFGFNISRVFTVGKKK
ncbi:DUF5777 family beta-barrel protein [Pseudobacter ginsenosidimutans]|uniref:DUF5777 domain-containing protein n=1 Tax=Pseudobacter ginsenosidimutans TaxID=661488 RepID=A0A4Q7MSE0_9BACT|nr:DUF5777 family beta-barrel protein [Pseudobacter ginsenosidimutans]QEC41809.1 hypothetical protein FSB84_08930 [Pseudobacter ginsenosidimutans]RZS71378.1 hypothetical protein EV199_3281 [Pseudobacter ginsenosidimutans]